MKSIREKLMVPILWFITLTPLVSLFVFNIGINKMIQISVDSNLKSTAISAYSEINQTLKDGQHQTDKIFLDEKTEEIRRVLYNNRRVSNVEIYLFDSLGQFKSATGYTISQDDESLIENIENKIDLISIQNVLEISTPSGRYAVIGYRASGLFFSENPYIVFVSSYNILESIIAVINLSLFAMIAIGVVISSIITDSISKKFEKSLTSLNQATQKISEKEDFITDETIDIKEIHNLSIGIKEMAKKLHEYDLSQKAFLQNVSHEIKNPLMAIQGYAEGLEKGIFDDPKEAGEIINKESVRLNNLLNELLTLTKIENRQYVEESQIIDLNELIKDYTKILNGFALKENKEIRVFYNREALYIKVNEELLHQCIINIGGNAIRYAKKIIDISVEKEKDFAVIKIKDDGPGFSKEESRKMFTKFYKGKQGMFGLGLPIAREAAKQIGGEIKAENTGSGALFVIKIPVC